MKTKRVWIAWTNTDLTEGRGRQIPLAICETRTTAMRLGKRGSVMGCDCEVEPFDAVERDGRLLAPFHLHNSTTEDDAKEKMDREFEEAISQARKSGMSEDAINVLMKGHPDSRKL